MTLPRARTELRRVLGPSLGTASLVDVHKASVAAHAVSGECTFMYLRPGITTTTTKVRLLVCVGRDTKCVHPT